MIVFFCYPLHFMVWVSFRVNAKISFGKNHVTSDKIWFSSELFKCSLFWKNLENWVEAECSYFLMENLYQSVFMLFLLFYVLCFIFIFLLFFNLCFYVKVFIICCIFSSAVCKLLIDIVNRQLVNRYLQMAVITKEKVKKNCVFIGLKLERFGHCNF